MWPFSRKHKAPTEHSAEDIAIAYFRHKWQFFNDNREFSEDVPLRDRIDLFTSKYLTDVIAYDARLKTTTKAERHNMLLRGITTSGYTDLQELEQALGHPLPRT